MLRLLFLNQDRVVDVTCPGTVTVRLNWNPEYRDRQLTAMARASLAIQLNPKLSQASAGEISDILSRLPRDVPPHVNIHESIEVARRMTFSDFYSAVRNKGFWDFKQRDPIYEDFGNFHFGIVAKAFGFPDDIALRGAGFAQKRAKTSRPEFGRWWLGPPFGDDFIDHIWIKNAIEMWREFFGKGLKEHDITPHDRDAPQLRVPAPTGDRMYYPGYRP